VGGEEGGVLGGEGGEAVVGLVDGAGELGLEGLGEGVQEGVAFGVCWGWWWGLVVVGGCGMG